MKGQSKVLVGMEKEFYLGWSYDRLECGDYEEVEALCMCFNLFFSDGTSLSLWEGDSMCPSGYQPCTYGRWKWEDKKPPRWMRRLKGGPKEVLIVEDKRGLKIKYSSNGRNILRVDEYGEDIYYPSGFVSLDLGLFK